MTISQRPAIGRAVLALGAVAIIMVAGIVYFSMTTPGGPTTGPVESTTDTIDKISLPDGVSICSGDCGHPSPYLSATVLVNSTGPIASLRLFVNGTDEGSAPLNVVSPYDGSAMESFYYQYQAYPNSTSMLIQAGKTYSIEVLATFADGETSTATALTTATSVPATTTSSDQVTTKTVSSTLCPSSTICGSITSAPTGQVRVDSVLATQFVCQSCGAVNGDSYVEFAVTFENIGNSPIYFLAGSSGVAIAMSPPAGSILQKVISNPCQGIFAIATLNPGQNYTLYGPSCEAGYIYHVVQAGSVNLAFSFNWTTNSTASTNPADFSNSTTISAQFIFA